MTTHWFQVKTIHDRSIHPQSVDKTRTINKFDVNKRKKKLKSSSQLNEKNRMICKKKKKNRRIRCCINHRSLWNIDWIIKSSGCMLPPSPSVSFVQVALCCNRFTISCYHSLCLFLLTIYYHYFPLTILYIYIVLAFILQFTIITNIVTTL